ncbi:MAG: dihydrolipoyl dehydrogenase family protein [Patescibacteria group bacterium]
MNEKQFDVIVIGSGAGAKISSFAAQRGMRVALIEDGPLGGTCLNRGCIPSKIYVHTADIARAIRQAGIFNLQASFDGTDFAGLVKRVTGYTDSHAQKMESGTKRNPNITLYQGHAEFVGKKTLQIHGEHITAEKILIAVGARPFIPSIDGLAGTPYLTSTEALRLRTLPRELVVIGGGYIGVELGGFFSALGTRVTVVQASDRLIDREDEDVARVFTDVFSRSQTVLLKHTATKVEYTAGQFTVTVQGPTGKREIGADQLLVATGVTPNADTTTVRAGDIDIDERGFIKVNEYLETSVPGVFAIGDVIGGHMFRHSANWQARYAIQNMFTDQHIAVDMAVMPHAVFSHPQVAGVGATETELRQSGRPYTVGRADYSSTAMGEAYQERDGFVKVLADEKKQLILGCHIIGPEASTLIHEVVVAMRAGGSVAAITDSVHIHPAMSEVVQRAFVKLV